MYNCWVKDVCHRADRDTKDTGAHARSLSQHYFLDLKEAAAVLNSWKEDYNKVRPHGSLGQLTPACYRAGWSITDDPERLAKCA